MGIEQDVQKEIDVQEHNAFKQTPRNKSFFFPQPAGKVDYNADYRGNIAYTILRGFDRIVEKFGESHPVNVDGIIGDSYPTLRQIVDGYNQRSIGQDEARAKIAEMKEAAHEYLLQSGYDARIVDALFEQQRIEACIKTMRYEAEIKHAKALLARSKKTK